MEVFDREFLIGHGVPEDRAEAVLAAHEAAVSAALEGTVTEDEARAMVEKALEGTVTREEAQRMADEAAGQECEAYRALEAERDMLRAIGGEDFVGVKPKFREQVYAMLDRGQQARPVAEQLEAIREQYEEFFLAPEATGRMPRFGGPTRGSLPRGAIGAAEQFSRAWGFGARGNG